MKHHSTATRTQKSLWQLHRCMRFLAGWPMTLYSLYQNPVFLCLFILGLFTNTECRSMTVHVGGLCNSNGFTINSHSNKVSKNSGLQNNKHCYKASSTEQYLQILSSLTFQVLDL